MKLRITAAFLLILFLAPVAMAGHDYRQGAYASTHQWARYYADTAIAQVRQNRRQHCNYYGQRWSDSHYDHLNWALRVSRGHAQSEINQRERDLRHCQDRHGRYYRDDGRYYNSYGHDYRGNGRYYGHKNHAYGHHKRDHRNDWRDHRSNRHDEGRHDGRDPNRDRGDDRRGSRDRHDRRRGG